MSGYAEMNRAPPLDRRRSMLLLAGAAMTVSRPAFSAETFKPPLWVIREGAAKVYLFGEMYAGRDFGASTKVVAAVSESAEFWKETPPGNQLEFEALAAKFGRAKTPLTERLGAPDAKRLLSAAAAIKFPAETLQALRGWLAVQTLQGPLSRSRGVSIFQDAGVNAAAKKENKPIRHEFADSQAVVRYFADMSPDADKEYLLWTIAEFEAGPEAGLKRAEAWAVGDLSPLEPMVRRMAKDWPAFYASIVVARNKAWVPRIRGMLEGGATSFVMVGTYHLVGPDSIQRQLEKCGLKVERIS